MKRCRICLGRRYCRVMVIGEVFEEAEVGLCVVVDEG